MPKPWRIFLLLLVSFIMLSGIFLGVLSSRHAFLNLNFLHNTYLNILFTNYTLLGDGIFSIALFIIMILLGRATLAAHIIVTYLVSGIVVQVLKRLIVAPRPKAVFLSTDYAWFIDGVTNSGLNSFPSGHTASAFALATIFTLHSQHKNAAFVYFFMALLIGYSRIYLGQHFLEDVVAGTCIGVLCALAVYRKLREVKVEWPATAQTTFRVFIHQY